LNKKKSQASTDPDVKIRFGWKFWIKYNIMIN
jgi:hypothetical protein